MLVYQSVDYSGIALHTSYLSDVYAFLCHEHHGPDPCDHQAKSAPSQAARYSAAVHLADGSMAYPLCFTAGIDGCETFQIKKASQTGQIYQLLIHSQKRALFKIPGLSFHEILATIPRSWIMIHDQHPQPSYPKLFLFSSRMPQPIINPRGFQVTLPM